MVAKVRMQHRALQVSAKSRAGHGGGNLGNFGAFNPGCGEQAFKQEMLILET